MVQIPNDGQRNDTIIPIQEEEFHNVYSQMCSWRSNPGVWWLWAGKASYTPPWDSPTQQRCSTPKVVTVGRAEQTPTAPGKASSSGKPVKMIITVVHSNNVNLNNTERHLQDDPMKPGGQVCLRGCRSIRGWNSHLLQWHPDDARRHDFNAVEFQQPPALLLGLIKPWEGLNEKQAGPVHDHYPLVLASTGHRSWNNSMEVSQTLFHLRPSVLRDLSERRWDTSKAQKGTKHKHVIVTEVAVTLSCPVLWFIINFLHWGRLQSNAVQSLLTFPSFHLLLYKPGEDQVIHLKKCGPYCKTLSN